MAVGLPAKTTYVDGDVFSASDINDTNGTINLIGQTTNFYAGKNRIINGDFGIWQRGTSFTPASGAYTYTADRSGVARDGVGATVTISQQSFTPGTAPVAGYESSFFFRNAQSVAGTLGTYNTTYSQIVEDVRTFAGQTVTFSFWAKSDASRTLGVAYAQYFGTGGSSAVYSSTTNVSVTTSWARYSVTFAIPSITGKTIGTGQVGLELYISQPLNTAQTNDIWGVQLEAGSTATAFQTATGTIQGELAACQRYFQRLFNGAEQQYENLGLFQCTSSSAGTGAISFLVPMRVSPTLSVSSASHFSRFDASGGSLQTLTSFTFFQTSPRRTRVNLAWTSGTTAGNATDVLMDNTSGTMDASAEL
jgi:hypothetical protein